MAKKLNKNLISILASPKNSIIEMIFQLYLLRLDVIESSTYLHIQKLVHALLYHSSVLGFFFFNVDHFLKSLLNFLQYRFCFMFWFFGRRAYGILAP